MASLALYLRTARHLRPIQVVNRLSRKLPASPRREIACLRRPSAPWIPFPDYQPAPLLRPSRLRDYTESYQHGIVEPDALAWAAANPEPSFPAWDPYPLSRRIVNWIKTAERPAPALIAGIARQASFLSRRIEYHLLANHLFVNAKALVFAGTFLSGSAAGRWRRQGLAILQSELPEQIFQDGGHFERSPMYHSLILEDLLDLVNLEQRYSGLLPDFREPASCMLSWLGHMQHPDGEIPFFGDACLGVAPPPAGIFAYARRLGITPHDQPLADSGFVRLERARALVLFNAGGPNPPYQPGHSHADALSFELSLDGRRLLVNSGISTYEANQERHNQRATSAHNCLVLDGRDQSEIWGAFRMGRRATVFDRQVEGCRASASHDGYRPVLHRRTLTLDRDFLRIDDRLEGSGVHGAALYFHLYPGASPDCVELDSRLRRSLRDTLYFPCFDRSERNQTVTGEVRCPLPLTLTTHVRFR